MEHIELIFSTFLVCVGLGILLQVCTFDARGQVRR